MARQYVWKKKDGTFTRPYELDATMAAAGVKLVTGDGPFTVVRDGETVGRPSTRVVTLRRLRRLLDLGQPGPTYRVRSDAGEIVFVTREVKAAVDVVNTSGNDKADVFWSTVVAEFREYDPRFAGAYVCKSISGSSTPSQHSYGNAVDIFFDTLAHQEKVAEWAVAHADELHLQHVISGNRIWTRGVGWRAYGGDFHAHLHVDFDPSFSGACGVKP